VELVSSLIIGCFVSVQFSYRWQGKPISQKKQSTNQIKDQPSKAVVPGKL